MENQKVTWGSHIPLHKAIIKTYGIKDVVEYGAGIHSTKMFFDAVPFVTSIETDHNWIDYVRKSVEQNPTHFIKHLDILDHLPRRTHIKNIRNFEVESSLFNYVKERIPHIVGYQNTKQTRQLMFVDCISSLRHFILNEFYKNHTVITFHDYNKKGRHNHWNGGVRCPDGYTMFVDATYKAHTGIWLDNRLIDKLDQLKQNHLIEVKNYTGSSFNSNIIGGREYGNM